MPAPASLACELACQRLLAVAAACLPPQASPPLRLARPQLHVAGKPAPCCRQAVRPPPPGHPLAMYLEACYSLPTYLPPLSPPPSLCRYASYWPTAALPSLATIKASSPRGGGSCRCSTVLRVSCPSADHRLGATTLAGNNPPTLSPTLTLGPSLALSLLLHMSTV